MTKQTLCRVAITVIFLFIGVLTVQAQPAERLFTLRIQFDFQVNETVLPAGEYTFSRIPQIQNLIVIEDQSRKLAMTVLTNPVQESEDPVQNSLTFNEYGEKRFLVELKGGWRNCKYTLIKSKTERKLAQAQSSKTIRSVIREKRARSQSGKHDVTRNFQATTAEKPETRLTANTHGQTF